MVFGFDGLPRGLVDGELRQLQRTDPEQFEVLLRTRDEIRGTTARRRRRLS